MRDDIVKLLDGRIKYGKGFEYLIDAIELYRSGDTLKSIYAVIADKRNTSIAAVEKNIALAVESCDGDGPITPKAFIARAKERIMFDFGEYAR